MSRISLPIEEAIDRLESSVHGIQVEYNFLSRYLSEEDKQRYAKAYVKLDELVQVLRCVEEEM